MESSGAVQMRDLCAEFLASGYEITVMTSSAELKKSAYLCEESAGLKILRVPGFKSKNVGLFRRALSEFSAPLRMLWVLLFYRPFNSRFQGIIWYSPTIFLGLVVHYLKWRNGCKAYLILRDIFPDWALHTGALKKGMPFYILKSVANYQYWVANYIGVQARGNLKHLSSWDIPKIRKIEVLNNWLSRSTGRPSSIQIAETKLVGRKIFVYAGNMGLAQGMQILFELAYNLRDNSEYGFLFVGRGEALERYRADPRFLTLPNILFHDFIDPSEIHDLYKQCYVGLLCLDVKHQTHNIPGKFLSYMASELPVLASVNPNNDLIEMIEYFEVGAVIDNGSVELLLSKLLYLDQQLQTQKVVIKANCHAISRDLFDTKVAVKQIAQSLS